MVDVFVLFLQKPSIWSKKNAGVLERAQHDLEVKEETDDVIGRSKWVCAHQLHQ